MYDDNKFGVVERIWFGATTKHGGQANAPITFNETEGNKVARWYPYGPVRLLKWGIKTVATLGKGEELFKLQADATTTLDTLVASTTSAPYTVNSAALTKDFTAGSYLNILASTNVCSTGSVAIFIDFRRKFSGTRHDASS